MKSSKISSKQLRQIKNPVLVARLIKLSERELKFPPVEPKVVTIVQVPRKMALMRRLFSLCKGSINENS